MLSVTIVLMVIRHQSRQHYIQTMKALALLPIAALIAAPVSAAPTLEPSASITRGDAKSIRACAEEFGGPYSAVCYNQTTTVTATVLPEPISPFTREKERVVRVRCDVPHTASTLRGKVASEFCPQVRAGVLAPAPFLL